MDINNLWSEYDLNSKKQNTRCLAVNTILEGKYLVGPVLGQGGFGITYVGFDLNMELKIAIKEYFPVELVSRDTTTMHGDRVLSMSGEKSVTYQQGLKKYVAEAQNVSQFSEIPGVVSVKDFFYANETAYIVMEFIDGISLKDYLKEKGGSLTEEETLKIMKPVLEALVQVHKSGIIHRDISPDNIMLTFKDGKAHKQIESVKLIDFGAARMTAKNDQKSLTIILKHGYAPEEQYRTHGEQGSWTDVYALCAVLYRMLTGETPVPAMDRMFKDELKPLKQCGAKVGANTAAAILKGLAVKKDDRIQSVQELMEALYDGKKVAVASGTNKKKLSMVIGAGSAAMVLAAIIGVAAVRDSSEKNAETTQTIVTEIDPTEEIETEMAETTESDAEETEAVLAMEEEEEIIGEVIVTPCPQTSMSGSDEHVVVRKEDGTVEAFGSNEYGQCEVGDWTHIAAVAAGDTYTAGLREDGIVYIAGELETADEVELWENIVEISALDKVLFGLKADGTLVSSSLYGESGDYYEWENICSIACSHWAFAALTEDGNILISKGVSKFNELAEISGWTDVEQLVCAQAAVFGLTADGDVRYASMFSDVEKGYVDFTNMESFHEISQLYSHYGFAQIGVRYDGSLCVGGTIFEEQFPMQIFEWDGLRGICGVLDAQKIIGLKKDGTIVKVVKNYGNSTPDQMTDLKWVLADWRGNLIGIREDGSVLSYGPNMEIGEKYGEVLKQSGLAQLKETNGGNLYFYLKEDGQAYTTSMNELKWNHIKQIETLGATYAGLTEDGTVKAVNFNEHSIEDFNRMMSEVSEWKGIEQIGISEVGIFGLKDDGSVIYCNEGKYAETRQVFEGVKSIFSGKGNVAVIKNDGTAEFFADTDNTYGQRNIAAWDALTQLAIGNYHTVGLREDGTVVATGNNKVGQCEVEEWSDIKFVAVGDNCTLGISEDGTLKIAGEIDWQY